jgi:large subunit ribosomal protein L10
MPKPKKIEMVEKLEARLAGARGVYFADFQGLNVAQATELRNRCREAGVTFEVVKNTLARRALDEKLRTDLDPFLVGPTAIATSDEDEVVPAKVLSDFLKEFERPVLKAGIVDGRVMDGAEVGVLASLPGREALLGKMVGGLKSPLQKLHAALSSPLRDVAAVLSQVAEKKS